MNFETGVARLTHLLEDISWPTALAWVRHDQVLYRPFLGTAVFRPLPDAEAEQQARSVFDERYGKAPGILFYAVGHDAGRTYALVEAIEEPAQGEAEMFISDGVKIAARSDGDRTQVIRSRVFWLARRALHRTPEGILNPPVAGCLQVSSISPVSVLDVSGQYTLSGEKGLELVDLASSLNQGPFSPGDGGEGAEGG